MNEPLRKISSETFRYAGSFFYAQVSFYTKDHERATVSSAYYSTKERAEKWLNGSIEGIDAPIDEAVIVEKWLSF